MIKKVITRSANDKLYSIFKSFWNADNEFIRVEGIDGFKGALDYLLFIINTFDGWVVSADEDFFLLDESSIDSLIQTMDKNGFVYCGVPDGKVISHRNNSEFNVNPFFNIFNITEIKKKIKDFDSVKDQEYQKAIELKYGGKHNLVEPFAGFFYWLTLNFKGAIFTDVDSLDGTDTIIKLNNKSFCIHSWYSRNYGTDLVQTKRIDTCIEYALLNRVK